MDGKSLISLLQLLMLVISVDIETNEKKAKHKHETEPYYEFNISILEWCELN